MSSLDASRDFSKNTVLEVGIIPAKARDLFTCYTRHPYRFRFFAMRRRIKSP